MVTGVLAIAITGAMVCKQQKLAACNDFGYFTNATDIGNPALAGSTIYDTINKTYTLQAAGTNMWYTHDEFHFVWRKLSGDFVLRTNAHFTSEGEPHRKMGWIVRTSLDDNSTHANAVVSGNGMASLQYRPTKGGQTEMIVSQAKAPDIIQFERHGNKFIMSVSKFGEPFTQTELTNLDLGNEVYVGLFLCSHNPAATDTVLFDNVSIEY